MKVESFEDVNKVLARYIPDSVETAYTLTRMTQLMGLLGNPQNSFKTVHVAGTAGKTSTSYYIAKMLQLSGQKVGLTISPHMDEVNERLQINNVPLCESKYCDYFAEFLEIDRLLQLNPTYFEILVAFAYWVFAREGVGYAVIEVGLGGLVDGTNVISREDKVCVITDIGLDHTRILGDNLPDIALQKAGIIHAGNHAFMAPQGKSVEKTVSEYAKSVNANLDIVDSVDDVPEYLPHYQQRNWSLSKSVFDYVANRDQLTKLDEANIDASAHIVIPGRMEVRKINTKTVILDGAHNGAKFEALSKTLASSLGSKKAVFLLGMVQSKEMHLEQVIKSVSPFAAEIICTSVQPLQEMPHTSLDPKIIEVAFKDAGTENIKTINNLEAALEQALQLDTDTIVITGSLYLLSEVRKLLKNKDSND